MRNTSSAVSASSGVTLRSSISCHSSNSSRVMPASGPALSGGVTIWSPKTKKMLVPVPSQTSPAVLRKIASLAPHDAAYASPRTFSAYEVDLTPVSAPFSLRRHGAVTTAVVAGVGHGLDGDDQVGRPVRGPRAERALTAGEGDAHLRLGQRPPIQRRRDPLAYQAVVGAGRPIAAADRDIRSSAAGRRRRRPGLP